MPTEPADRAALKRVFFATESGGSADADLTAIGLIGEDGSAPCLLELHKADLKAADETAPSNVVSMFARAPRAHPAHLTALGQQLCRHVASFGEPIWLCHEHQSDWQRFESALKSAGCWSDVAPLVHAHRVAREITTIDPPRSAASRNALETANRLRDRWLHRPATDDSPYGRLLAFLGYHGLDHRGSTLYALLSQSDDWMAAHGTYIQWMLPIDEHSSYKQRGPLLSRAEFERLAGDERARRGIGLARDRLLRYLGLELRDGQLVQRPCAKAVEPWGRNAGPDDLRVSRLLRSLVLTGFGDDARALYHGLETLVGTARGAEASEPTLAYWRAAAFKRSGRP